MELLRDQPKELILGMGTRWIEGLVFNAYGVFIISYVTGQLGLTNTTALIGIALASAFGVVLVPIYRLLSDRFDRRYVYGTDAALFGLFAFPSFLLINTGQPALIWLSIVVALSFIYPAICAPLAAFWSELLHPRSLYGGRCRLPVPGHTCEWVHAGYRLLARVRRGVSRGSSSAT